MKKDFIDAMGESAHYRRDVTPKGERKAIKKVPVEELPTKGSLGRRWGWKENRGLDTAPLRRFLRSHVGEKWDDVYAEIREVNDARNNPCRELIESLDYYVARDTQVVDGVVCDSKGGPVEECGLRNQFYVHPVTGILHAAKSSRRHKWESRNFPAIPIDDRRQYHRLDGVWHLVTFCPVDGSEERYPDVLAPFDKDLRPRERVGRFEPQRTYTPAELVRKYGSMVRAVSKTRAGKRDLKFIQEHLEKNGEK